MSDSIKNSNQSSAIEIIEEFELDNIPKIRANKIAAMLLAGYSNQEISEKLGLSIQIIRDTQKDKNFQRTLQLASAKIFDSAIARLCLNSAKAVDVIVEILDNPDSSDRIKLQAAKIILDVAEKSKTAQLEQRLEALESLVSSNA